MYYQVITALVHLQLTKRLLLNTPANRLAILTEIRDVWADFDGEWSDGDLAMLANMNVMIAMHEVDMQFQLN